MIISNEIPNKLIEEKSPYLLQHAYNPVNWYPWCEEAFQKAKDEDKPIFLSIGYATCHWCHVMERESFEDEQVAEILNNNFISIKVDREERPDIDNIYMTYCQSLTGHGGWPLSIFMTSDQKPFYAGTYFPKMTIMSHPGFIDILNRISMVWQNNKSSLLEASNRITDEVNQYTTANSTATIDKDIFHTAFEYFETHFDKDYGGFNTAPKFPTPHNLNFLLRYYKITNNKKALEMVERTLKSMYKGGIYDHIGFGFSRYSTDQKWLVPHFEKMLYDNALLSILYTEAYQVTKNPLYKDVSEKILEYVIRDMTDDSGGFYSAEDADSEGVEGKFYVWTLDELKNILSDEEIALFSRYYDITDEGNFEGKSIPNLIKTNIDELHTNEEIKSQLNSIINKLYDEREKRIHPLKDDKILTSWNGLMIVALAIAGRTFDHNIYIQKAEMAANFIVKNLRNKDGRLLSRYREGEAKYLAYLDSYAYLVWGFIELYQSTFKFDYLNTAIDLNNRMLELFWDHNEGGLFLYADDSEQLILRPKELYDGALPSGNSVASYNMIRLSRLTGNTDYEEKINAMFKIFGGTINSHPSAFTFMLLSKMYQDVPTKEIVVVGDYKDKDTKQILASIYTQFQPFTTIVLNDGNEQLHKLMPFTKDQKKVNNKTTVYVCENFACQQPINNIEELEKLL